MHNCVQYLTKDRTKFSISSSIIMSSSDADVCATCSETIKPDELKNVIKCNVCEKFFHAACQGPLQPRGLHMKRPTWKCMLCSSSDPDPGKISCGDGGVKRLKSQDGDVIEVDRLLVKNLLKAVEDLSSKVSSMKTQMDALEQQNKKLVDMVNVLKDKQITVPISSYAAILNKNNADVNKRPSNNAHLDKSSNWLVDSPINHSGRKTLGKIPFKASQAVLDALGTPPGRSTAAAEVNEGFETVKTKTKRGFKKPVIGQRETNSAADNSNSSKEQNLSSVLTGAERRHWVYVGRVTASTSTEAVTEYVKSTWSLSDVKCIQLARNEDYCSFKVGVMESQIQSLLDASKWPKFVAVREFVQLHRKRIRSDGGNFPVATRAPSGT